jgi:hypothetical protein
VWCTGVFQGKVGRIQVLGGLAPSSQTVGCNIRTLRSHQRSLLPAEADIDGNQRKTIMLFYPDPQKSLSYNSREWYKPRQETLTKGKAQYG